MVFMIKDSKDLKRKIDDMRKKLEEETNDEIKLIEVKKGLDEISKELTRS